MLPDDYQPPKETHMQVKHYTYKLPDTYVMEPQHREKLDNLVAKTNLNNVQAQAFVDLHVELTEGFVARLMPTVWMIAALCFILTILANVVVGVIINA